MLSGRWGACKADRAAHPHVCAPGGQASLPGRQTLLSHCAVATPHTMRTSVTIALLGFVALLASFADAAVKSKDGASAKHARMLKQAQAATDKILEVKGLQDFEDLTGSPRNFSISMLLTAVESGVQCGPCVTFQPSYVNLAKSHARLKGDAVNRHLFALLEFKNGKEVFQRVSGCSLTTDGTLARILTLCSTLPARTPIRTRTSLLPRHVRTLRCLICRASHL